MEGIAIYLWIGCVCSKSFMLWILDLSSHSAPLTLDLYTYICTSPREIPQVQSSEKK